VSKVETGTKKLGAYVGQVQGDIDHLQWQVWDGRDPRCNPGRVLLVTNFLGDVVGMCEFAPRQARALAGLMLQAADFAEFGREEDQR